MFASPTGIVTADPRTHFNMLRTIWFENYSRGMGKIGSSAFEHVFLGEIKNHTQVSGLHNWVYYYMKEGQFGHSHPINYMGYMNSVVLGNVCTLDRIFLHDVFIRLFINYCCCSFLLTERSNCQIPFQI